MTPALGEVVYRHFFIEMGVLTLLIMALAAAIGLLRKRCEVKAARA